MVLLLLPPPPSLSPSVMPWLAPLCLFGIAESSHGMWPDNEYFYLVSAGITQVWTRHNAYASVTRRFPLPTERKKGRIHTHMATKRLAAVGLIRFLNSGSSASSPHVTSAISTGGRVRPRSVDTTSPKSMTD